jgi:hypothetical protein
MKTLAKTAAAVAIVAASLSSAQAFWGGGPWNSWSNGAAPWNTWTDMFGDIDANFSSRGWGRGSGYGYPHYGYGYGPGYGAYPYFGAPVAAPVAVAPVVQAK